MKFVLRLPVINVRNTTVGGDIWRLQVTGGLEVTGEVFESAASIVSGPAVNRPYHLAIFVAARGGQMSNACGHA